MIAIQSGNISDKSFDIKARWRTYSANSRNALTRYDSLTPSSLLRPYEYISANAPKLSNQFTASFNYINLNAGEAYLPNHYISPPEDLTTASSTSNSNPSQSTQPSSTAQAPINTTASQSPSQAQVPTQTADVPNDDAPAQATGPRPPSPATFAAAQKELAGDIMKKRQQIVDLIDILPGLGRSQAAQEARIAELEEELKAVEAERRVALGEREKAIEVLEEVISGFRR